MSKILKVKQGASAVLASMTNAKAGFRPFEASANHAANGNNAVAEVVKLAPPAASRSSSSSSSSARKGQIIFRFYNLKNLYYVSFFPFSCGQETKGRTPNAEDTQAHEKSISQISNF